MQIPTERALRLDGPIDDATANRLIAHLLFFQMEGPKDPIPFAIASEGGSVTATFAIVDTMRQLSCPIHTSCESHAFGCALLIFCAGTPGQRTAAAGALFGLTPTTAGVMESVTTASAEAMERTAKFLVKINRRLIGDFSAFTGQPAHIIEAAMEESRAFTAQKALQFGIADRVKADPEERRLRSFLRGERES